VNSSRRSVILLRAEPSGVVAGWWFGLRGGPRRRDDPTTILRAPNRPTRMLSVTPKQKQLTSGSNRSPSHGINWS